MDKGNVSFNEPDGVKPRSGGARGRGNIRGARGRGRGKAPQRGGFRAGPPRGGRGRGKISPITRRSTAATSRMSPIVKLSQESGYVAASYLRETIKKQYNFTLDHDNANMLLHHFAKESKNQSELTAEEFDKAMSMMAEIKARFDEIDADNSNSIDNKELKDYLNFIGIRLSDEVLQHLVDLFDDDKTGEIELGEFFNLVLYVQELEYQYKLRVKSQDSGGGSTDFRWVKKLVGVSAADPHLIQTLSESENMTFSLFMKEIILALQRNKAQRPKEVTKIRKERKKPPKLPGNFRSLSSSHKSRVISRIGPTKKYSREEPFVDDEFPANKNSLGLLNQKVTSWKRPIEISPNPRIFVDGVEEGDVVQGSLGNCWFLGALSILACSGNHLIDQAFVSSCMESGRHVCKFFKNGGIVEVEVDDLIPCGADGKPAFASCKDPDEFWVPILEKAYAKLHGGYDKLKSGLLSYALKDVTGEPVESLLLNEPNTLPCNDDNDSLWELLVSNIQESFVMGCSIASPVALPEETNSYNLLLNHAYGIIDCQEVQGNKLLRIRNPWGNYEWNGRWSDNAAEWTPEIQAHFGNFEFDNDGTFFMCFEDFITFFNSVNVLRLLTDDVGEIWEKNVIDGEWATGTSAGGCMVHNTWKINPQYLVSTTKPNARVFVCLSQEDKRYFTQQATKLDSIGITAMRGDNRTAKFRKKISCQPSDIIKTSSFVAGRDCSIEFMLEKAGDTAVIVPSFYYPDLQSSFSLMVFLQYPGDVKQLIDKVEIDYGEGLTRKETGWTELTAGGCLNYPSWISNPQYILTCTEPCEVTITITQELAQLQPPVPVGAYIFDATHLKGFRIGNHNATHSAKIAFINLETVEGTLTIYDPDIPFMIMPCTFEPGIVRGYSIDVSCSNGTSTLHEAKYWTEGTLTGQWRDGLAGGNMNKRLWRKNPTFHLEITGEGPCTFSIALFVPALVRSKIGFYLFEDLNNNGVMNLAGLRGNCPFKATYSNIFDFINIPPKKYIILPCTQSAKDLSDFFITVLNNRCSLTGPYE